MFDWMQENWWVPLIIAFLLLVLFIGFNENTRNTFIEWRQERNREARELEVYEAEILPVVTPISPSQSSHPPGTAKSSGVAPESFSSTAATVELVEVVEAEVIIAEEVIEAEFFTGDEIEIESEDVVVETEVEIAKDEADNEEDVVTEAEIVEVESVDDSTEVGDTTDDDEDEELDAFLADFDDDDFD
jgi:hypothetical protein